MSISPAFRERVDQVRRLIKGGRIADVDDAVALGQVAKEYADEEAIPLLQRALGLVRMDWTRVFLLIDLASVHRNLGQFERSLRYTEEAFRRAPSSVEARIDRSHALLLQRLYREAWPESDFRLLFAKFTRQFKTRGLWDGQSTGQRVYVTLEQGRGDQIQMVRFLRRDPLARNTLFVECHAGLGRLFSRLPNIARVLEVANPSASVALSENEFDSHIPYMSLPGRFNAAYDEGLFTGRYIEFDDRQSDWPGRIAGGLHRVGLVWRGDRRHPRDRYRSIPLGLLEPLFGLDGIQFYSLAVDCEARDELRDSDAHRSGRLIDLGDYLTDFDQTASAVANLDRLITVDTAVAHLAGAMGVTVWTLLSKSCDWRWGLEGETTRWYPSMELFRQEDLNRWEPVIERVRDRLAWR